VTRIAREDLEALICRAALSLTPSQIGQLLQGWALVAPMLDRIRNPSRDRSVETAHIFRAAAYTLRPGETDAS